jgi:hypothetical protein
MINRLKNSAGPTSRQASSRMSGARALAPVPLQVLVGVLDHHDGGVHHGADGDGDAAEAHDVGVHAQRVHDGESDQHPDRQHEDGHQGAPEMQQEQRAYRRHHRAFLDQGAAQVVDGPEDQVGAVVHRLDRDAFRQARREFGQAVLDVLDDLQGVLAVAGQRDAGNHLALAVEFGDAAPLVRDQFHPRHVAQQHRGAVLGLEDQAFQVGLAMQVAAPAHHVLGLRPLDHPAADIAVAVLQHLGHRPQRKPEGLQLVGIDRDLVLLDEAAEARDLRHALGLGQLVAHEPVLQGAQFRQRIGLAQQRVLVDPAHPGGVRPQLRRHVRGQAPGGEVQVFQDAGTRPVDIGAVLENDVDEGRAEEGEPRTTLERGTLSMDVARG